MATTPLALGWRVRSWSAVVVAVRGTVDAPVVVHRDQVALLADESRQEPYHAATVVPRSEAPALIASIAEEASEAATTLIGDFVASLGPVAAVGVVGGDRRLPELDQILRAHARLHAAERDLYERAVVRAAERVGLPVSTIPATGNLFADASAILDVDVVAPLTALGAAVGRPWQKDHKEAAAAAVAFVALHRARMS